MKKITTIIAIALAFSSCEKSELIIPETNVFHATMESNLTKTTLSDNGAGGYDIVWATTDRILIKHNSYKGIYKPATAASSSDFVYDSGYSMTEPDFQAYYPSSLYNDVSSTTALPIELSLDNGVLKEFPMYAESSTTDLGFKNLCGVLRLKLKGSAADLMGKVVISADEPLAGQFTVEPDADAFKAVSTTGSTKITINVSGSTTLSSGYDLWIPVFARSYTNLAIKVYKSDGTYYSLKTANSTIIVERSRITEINLSTMIFATPTPSLSGSGTSEDPYTLSSETDIEILRERIDLGENFSGKYFKVLNDFTISRPHTPLGRLTCNTFDGGHRTITLAAGFDMSACPVHAGFFSEFSGTLKDMNITGADVSLTEFQTSKMEAFGVLVGYWNAKSGTVSGCNNSINVMVTSSSANALYVGGLMGFYYGTQENCHNTGNISVSSTVLRSYTTCVGGIVGNSGGIVTASNSGNITATNIRFCGGISGYISGSGMGYYVDKCKNTGDISSTTQKGASTASNRVRAGGIAGYCSSMYVRNSCNTGAVSAWGPVVYYPGSIAGGIVGETSSLDIKNCFNLGNISSRVGRNLTENATYTCKALAGGISGMNGTVTNCYSAGTLSTLSSSMTGSGWSYGRCEGGIISMVSYSSVYLGEITYCYYPNATLDESSYLLSGIGYKTGSTKDDFYQNANSSTNGNAGTSSSSFVTATLVTGGTKSAPVTINATEYPVGTSILTLLNEERNVLGTSVYLPWKAGTGDPAYPIFDE